MCFQNKQSVLKDLFDIFFLSSDWWLIYLNELIQGLKYNKNPLFFIFKIYDIKDFFDCNGGRVTAGYVYK